MRAFIEAYVCEDAILRTSLLQCAQLFAVQEKALTSQGYKEIMVVDRCCNPSLSRESAFRVLASIRVLRRLTHRGKTGIYDSGNTTRSAPFLAPSRIKATVFCTVFAVSRNTGATLHAKSVLGLTALSRNASELTGDSNLW